MKADFQHLLYSVFRCALVCFPLMGCDAQDGGADDQSPERERDMIQRYDVAEDLFPDEFTATDADYEYTIAEVTPGEDEEEACVAVSLGAAPVLLPVDIIWMIDASPSMDGEITTIEGELNSFAQRIGLSGLDYRVVLIGSDSEHCDSDHCYFEICVPPPLSAEAVCPDIDSEVYLHVREPIHSHDGLEVTVNSYGEWGSFLREESMVHFIMVTDDDTGWQLDDVEFMEFIRERGIGEPYGIKFHSIIEFEIYGSGSCGNNRGDEYINLSELTGGETYDICEDDWEPIFSALEEAVSVGTAVPCQYEIPDPGEGLEIDPELVNVVFLTAVDGVETRETVLNVGDSDGCGENAGWYYDDPVNPVNIYLCEEICGEHVQATVEIEFGCNTVKF